MGRILLNDIFKTTECLSSTDIQNYLQGQANPANKRRVEEHLLDCPLCSDAVEGFESVTTNIALPEDFATFRKKLPGAGEGQVRRLRPGTVLLRVAAVAAILVASYFTLIQSATPNHLFGQYFTSYRLDIPIDRRSSDAVPSLNAPLQTALKLYADSQYAACIQPFEKAIIVEPENEAAHFFAGLACLETGQFEKASGFLRSIEDGAGNYAAKATWYLALARLRSGDLTTAKELLKEIKAGHGFKQQEAAALLDDL